MNIRKGDEGGELDNRGSDGKSFPIRSVGWTLNIPFDYFIARGNPGMFLIWKPYGTCVDHIRLVGGLVFGNTFGNGVQFHDWTSFISDGEFCIRACIGPNSQKNCNHIYDLMGCSWVRSSSCNGARLVLIFSSAEHASKLRSGCL